MAYSYKCFHELSKREVEGTDYKIRFYQIQSPILIMAPHGGKIVPGTSESGID